MTRQANTPPALLAELACHFPVDFAQNPVAPLLALEVPHVIAELPTRKQRWAIASPYTPASFLSAIAASTEDVELRDEVSFHINVAGEISSEAAEIEVQRLVIQRVRRLRGINRKYLLQLIHAGFAEENLVSAQALSMSRQVEFTDADNTQLPGNVFYEGPAILRYLLLRSPRLPVRISGLYSKWEWLAAVSHPEAAALEFWVAEAAESANRYVRAKACALWGLTGEIVSDWRAELCGILNKYSPEKGVMALAAHRLLDFGTAPQWLVAGLTLGQAEVPDVITDWYGQSAAQLETLGAEELTKIALGPYGEYRPWPFFRCLALMHPATEEHFLNSYAKSPVWLDRLGVALHPDISTAHPTLHVTLASDHNQYVRAAAQAHRHSEKVAL